MAARANDYRRKTPEEILIEIERLKRGKWTLYIGAAPGVGKTYRMLQEAHELKKEGVDVVIGLVETHGRTETKALIGHLEEIPLKQLSYKDRTFYEMDTEGIIERNPELVIIDELAHTNVPGSKHKKRCMDVEDILSHGISVLSAVNIQHFESVHDIVQQITGVNVRERIPDRVLEIANEVILIDVTPETLQKRLRDGKIYHSSKIEQALSHFFSQNNLGALRELALREVANNVDDKMNAGDHPPAKGTNEKILVCIQYDRNAERLIRRGWRIASRLKAQLVVLNVTMKTIQEMNKQERNRLKEWERLCRQFDAHFVIEQMGGRKIPKVITDVAIENKITQIILGQSARSRWEEITKGSIVNNIMRYTDVIDIHIVADPNLD